jgi:hypothetical protein
MADIQELGYHTENNKVNDSKSGTNPTKSTNHQVLVKLLP